jgi:ribosomal-protein-alanine N-acetyltransferase
MVIRNMTEMDLVEVCAIEQETFSEPWTKEDFIRAFTNQNNGYLVAEQEGKITGYCGFWGIVGEGYIYNVAVKKEYRRQQIGYQLMKELIRLAYHKGVTSLTLEVRSTNLPAIRLYESLGFEHTGIRKDFYSKPKEDAVIMWLNPIQ